VILVDAGPLVALIDRTDPRHHACRVLWQAIDDELVTVWPVVTEAMHLLRKGFGAQDRLWEVIERYPILLAPLTAADLPRIRELMRKYRDLPMDLADAALVRIAERERIRRVFTVDRRDFEIYRPYRLGRFDIVP
jgi:predicted nucleic acid-binding protein